MVRLIKQVLTVLLSLSESLASVVDADHVKRVSLNNEQYMIQTTLINLHPNEYVAGLRYYPFAVNLDRCKGSLNTLNDLSIKVFVSKKTYSC